MKYSQNHFESTFGSAYFKPKKTKLKLVKTVKKGTKESVIPKVEPRLKGFKLKEIFFKNIIQ